MRKILQVISLVALVVTIAPSILYLLGRLSLDQSKMALLVATVVWFAATPFWMDRKAEE